MTRDEFQQKYGISIEEYRAAKQQQAQPPAPDQQASAVMPDAAPVTDPNVPAAPAMRRYGASVAPVTPEAAPVVPEAPVTREKPFVSMRQREADARGEPLSGYDKFLDTVNRPIEYVTANAISGVGGIAAALPSVAGLVEHGVPAVRRAYYSKDSKPFHQRVADEFVNGLIPEEGIKALQAVQLKAVDGFRQQHPDATPEQLADFAKQYAQSDDFYNATMDQIGGGIALGSQMQTGINKISGLNKRADQTTAGDEALQAVSSAFVGLGPAAIAKLTKPVVSAIGERIATSLPARIATRVAEAVTPLTLPLTPGNIAINAGVGVAMNEGIRALQGEETLTGNALSYDPLRFPAPEKLAAATGITAGAVFGLPAISRTIAKQAGEAVEKTISKFDPRVGQRAGPTAEEQVDHLSPQLSKMTGFVDENAPVKKAAQLFKAPSDTETVPQLDAAMSSVTNVNLSEKTNNALNYGILDGIPNTVPVAKLEETLNRLPPEMQDVFDKYVYSVMRKQDAAVYEKSLMEQISSAQGEVTSARLSGKKAAQATAEADLAAKRARLQQLHDDDPSTRSSMTDWTRDEVEYNIRTAEAIPEIKAIGDALRKVGTDLNEYVHTGGIIDAAEKARRNATRDLYVKLQRDPHEGKTGLPRRYALFKDRFTPSKSSNPDQGFFVNTAARDVTGEGVQVNNPIRAIDSLKRGVMDAVRSVEINRTRRDVVDSLVALPGAEGKLLRAHEFPLGNGRTTRSISPAQYAKLYPRGIKDEGDYVKVFRNGNIELWQFSDPSITKSLQFAPAASIPILNSTRTFFQSLTTGLGAPWFAARAFAWDVPTAQITKNADRTLGLIDTYARRLMQGTSFERPVNEAMANLFDPTAFATVGAAIPYQLALRAMKGVGDKIATDLATHSGVFNAIVKSGVPGSEFVKGVGTFMANAFDQSALAVMSRNMSTSLSHLNDVSKMHDDVISAIAKHSGPVGVALQGYKAVLESIHMATRTAFFATNYGNLKQKFGDAIPEAEIKKLIQETRNVTGDMSRRSGNRKVQAVTSVIPYSNAMLQGTRHILVSAMPQKAAEGVNALGGNFLTDRNNRFWSQFTSGLVLPMVGALATLSQWDGAEDYWYNKTPKWQQMTGIPMPSIDTLVKWHETGVMPKFHPDNLNIVPIAPEFVMILEPVIAGLRAMGMIGSAPTSVPNPFGQQVKDVMDQVTSFSTPPILQAIMATGGKRLDLHGMVTGQGGMQDIRNAPAGGANADMMTYNSNISNTVYNVIGALTGSAGQLAMQSLNVADISLKEGQSYFKALDNALDTAAFEAKRRAPQVSVPGLYDARTRAYAQTPEAQYVYKTKQELDPIIGSGRQLSVERDSKNSNLFTQAQGLDAANKLKDPVLRLVSEVIWNEIGKAGPYKQAGTMATEVRKQIAALEASRYKMPDDKYNDKRNEYVRTQQQLISIQSQALQQTEQKLKQMLNERFTQQYGVPFSYKNLSDMVRKDVAR